MGSGRGGSLTYALNTGGILGTPRLLGSTATGDHAGMVVTPAGAVIVGNANYEKSPEDADDRATITHYRSVSQASDSEIVFGPDTPGPLVLADFDGDQELDLFVGGQFQPGRYPFAATSRIYRGGGGQFAYDDSMSRPFADIGLVSGAAAGDLDGDGDTDLVLALDWGPVRVLVNHGDGHFVDHTGAVGLAHMTGWWNGVALGDFDGDSRLDLVATNWGSNTMYGHVTEPLAVYYGDIDRNGITDILEARYDPTLRGYGMVRDLRTLLHAIPPLVERVSSYREFSQLSATALFGGILGTMGKHEAATLSSTVFMNRGTVFEAVPLPAEAQWAPAFTSVVADFDGDGAEDLFLSQNFFATPASTPRMDAGRGLLLRGNGDGSFRPFGEGGAGIMVYGEQRAAAAGDVNRDGRVDLVVTQNAASAQLYMNTGGTPGLAVTLSSPTGGIGATVRLRYRDGSLGPARAVSAGSGYWSQNALTQVLGMARPVWGVRVRWPDGTETSMPVAEDQTAVTVRYRSGR